MGRKSFLLFLFYCLLLHHMLFVRCQALRPRVRALYVFGDSTVDCGNNERLLDATMKGNYPPYNIDQAFRGNGKFTNGLTIAEHIGTSLRMPNPSAFNSLAEEFKSLFIRGMNYASASAGILPETGTALGRNLCMEEQIRMFEETLRRYLPWNFKSFQELSQYLSKSIFVINIGSSDYIHNYLQSDKYNSSRLYNGGEFANLLVKELANHLTDLYNLGARKMIIFQIGPLGCYPYILNRVKPKTRCAEDVNKLVSIFNEKLDAMQRRLSSKLIGPKFIIVRTYQPIEGMLKNPISFGLIESREPCCQIEENGNGLCIPDKTPCLGRKLHLFWDGIHLTEAANKFIIEKCFDWYESYCYPYNIDLLVARNY